MSDAGGLCSGSCRIALRSALTWSCFIAEALQTQVGQRDGQQLFIRENDGSVTAHLWSASTSQWNLVSGNSAAPWHGST